MDNQSRYSQRPEECAKCGLEGLRYHTLYILYITYKCDFSCAYYVSVIILL